MKKFIKALLWSIIIVIYLIVAIPISIIAADGTLLDPFFDAVVGLFKGLYKTIKEKKSIKEFLKEFKKEYIG